MTPPRVHYCENVLCYPLPSTSEMLKCVKLYWYQSMSPPPPTSLVTSDTTQGTRLWKCVRYMLPSTSEMLKCVNITGIRACLPPPPLVTSDTTQGTLLWKCVCYMLPSTSEILKCVKLYWYQSMALSPPPPPPHFHGVLLLNNNRLKIIRLDFSSTKWRPFSNELRN